MVADLHTLDGAMWWLPRNCMEMSEICEKACIGEEWEATRQRATLWLSYQPVHGRADVLETLRKFRWRNSRSPSKAADDVPP